MGLRDLCQYLQLKREREIEREREKQTDRQTARERQRQRERQTDRQTERLPLTIPKTLQHYSSLDKKDNPGNPPANCYGFREDNPSSIDSLKDTMEVDPSRDLFDEHRSHTLGTQLLVDAKEIDLHHLL